MKKLRGVLIVVTLSITAILVCWMLNRKPVAEDSLGWNLLLVNEDYYIPEDYQVTLITLDNGERVDTRIYSALMEMFEAAESESVYMFVADGYRSEKEQQELMDEKTKEYQERVILPFVAEQLAEKWVAIPGTSEHQLGMAVDINADINRSSSAEVYNWLAKNAYKYGFIQRYPSDKTEVTGIRYEPWHYRYVGEEAAKEIFEKEICLEEYIEEQKAQIR